MAITSGAGPHKAWLNVDGATFPIEHGSVEQRADRESSTFSAAIPLSYPNAEPVLAGLGDNVTTIVVETRGVTATLITGEIDETNFDYIGRTIRVSGRDPSAKAHENVSSEKWINKKGSDIVQDLCGRIGLKCIADSSPLMAGKLLAQDYVKLSDNITFSHIIQKLAEFDGARVYVDTGGTLHYEISGNQGETYTLNYVAPDKGGFIKSDAMRLTIDRKVPPGKRVEVMIKSWNPKDKKVYEYKAVVPGKSGVLKFNHDIPNLKQDHVEQHAVARANEIARQELTLHASVAGDPNCNPSRNLFLSGTGYWDQQYVIDLVHHEIGISGHRTSITARSGAGDRAAS